MNTYMNAVLNANAPAVDNRLSGATRYSGDPADADIFLLRFSSTAQQLDFSPVYDGTERHSAPPNNQTAVLAMPETTWHERTEKRELLAENKKFLKKCVDAYHFVIQSLDTETALAVSNEAPDETDPAAAYDAMQRVLNDKGVITQMHLVVQLLQLKAENGEDPLALMRQQAQLATKLSATGCALPEPLLKALLLFALPSELSHLRTKYIDAEETPGHPMTLSTLKQRLTTQFQSAALADPESLHDQVNSVVARHPADASAASCQPCEDPRLTPELLAALVKLASNMCTHCGGVHKSEKCWVKFPALRPADIKDQANLAVPMF
jgi:hypothetical protein